MKDFETIFDEEKKKYIDPVELERNAMDNSKIAIEHGKDFKYEDGIINIIIVIEELSELQKALTKRIRHKGSVEDIIEEMADVYLAMNYIMLIYNISKDDLIRAVKVKNDRMTKILMEEENDKQ